MLDAETETAVYVETHTETTNENGLVILEIGGGNAVDGTFSGIDWSTGMYFLKAETDLTGGTDYTITGLSQLLSVPYALYSKSAETAKDAATKADVDELLDKIKLLQAAIGVTDKEGNHYKAVKIGSQVWMVENLRTSKFNDGSIIPLVPDGTEWAYLTTPAYCWYNNDFEKYGTLYGALYNWRAVESGKLCPAGWHVPNEMDWTVLINYLGGAAVAGGKLKATGTNEVGDGLWYSPNTGATNDTGFTGLPAGWRKGLRQFPGYEDGIFEHVMQLGTWWSSTEHNEYHAYSYLLDAEETEVSRFNTEKE